jgi:glycosyltransferase involved in cell wall biosynthesis
MTPRIAVVVSGFPRISETFALHELRALERRGLLAGLFATKPGDLSALQPEVGPLAERVEVLPSLDDEGQAAHVAERLKDSGVDAVHGYFAHAPAAVAAGAARRLGVRYGFSTHALDVRKVEPAELAERARGAACVLACNADVAGSMRAAGARVRLVPHGVDLDRFQPRPHRRGGPLRLLAVGRLVPKKGFDVLLRALQAGPDLPVQLRLVGAGPEHDRLEALAADEALRGRVELAGRRTHAELPADYAWADVLVAPSVTDASGDRDGLPNVVLEGLASGLPVVASDCAALPTAVHHERNGLLVPAGDPDALHTALGRLAADPDLRERLGRAARAGAEREHDLARATERFCDTLVEAYG